MQRFTRNTLLLVTLVLISGCRVGVSVFPGGDVLSASNERNCFEGSNCKFLVDDPLFTETFTAQPRNGFEFTRWKGGAGFLCANATEPTCTVNLADIPNAELIVASGLMGYLVPEFTCTGECPEIPDLVIRGLDEAIVALEEAKDAIQAYVATNGEGAPSPHLYGINLGTRSSDMLKFIEISPEDTTYAAGHDFTFYITARVYRRVWDDGAGPGETSGFSLSGQTNNDGSMTWSCIPKGPAETYVQNGPDAIPIAWLPTRCRL